MSIEVQKVSRSYGRTLALSEVSFSIGSGEIIGFLGPNGAGKSTLMKILTTYLSADSGAAKVNGFDVRSQAKAVRASVGYLPENNPLYLDLYVLEYLKFHAGIHGVSRQRIEEVIALVGLESHRSKKLSELSKGYKQRAGLGAALLHDPEVLILDEPTTGLDPNQLLEIRNLILEIGKTKTILLSTHIMQEVKAMCERVIILNQGEVVAEFELDKGAADQSYGLAVARLAGVPDQVVKRAKQVLAKLEESRNETGGIAAGLGGLPLFDAMGSSEVYETDPATDLVNRLAELDVDALSPRDALEALYSLVKDAQATNR